MTPPSKVWRKGETPRPQYNQIDAIRRALLDVHLSLGQVSIIFDISRQRVQQIALKYFRDAYIERYEEKPPPEPKRVRDQSPRVVDLTDYQP
jgi:hypothetical protein